MFETLGHTLPFSRTLPFCSGGGIKLGQRSSWQTFTKSGRSCLDLSPAVGAVGIISGVELLEDSSHSIAPERVVVTPPPFLSSITSVEAVHVTLIHLSRL